MSFALDLYPNLCGRPSAYALAHMGGLAMVARRDDNHLPPISGLKSEETSGEPRGVPEVEGYEILEFLSEGGMGAVWCAVQLSTRRQVALKLFTRTTPGSDKPHACFERGIELAARPQHPKIAGRYDNGRHSDVHSSEHPSREARSTDVELRA